MVYVICIIVSLLVGAFLGFYYKSRLIAAEQKAAAGLKSAAVNAANKL